MKKFLLLMLLKFCSVIVCFGQKGEFKINVSFDSKQKFDTIYLFKQNDFGEYKILLDSTISKNGLFKFNGNIEQDESAAFVIKSRSKSKYVGFYIKPTRTFVLTDTVINIKEMDNIFIVDGGIKNRQADFINNMISINYNTYLNLKDSAENYQVKNPVLANHFMKLALCNGALSMNNILIDSLISFDSSYNDNVSILQFIYMTDLRTKDDNLKFYNKFSNRLKEHPLSKSFMKIISADTLSFFPNIENHIDTGLNTISIDLKKGYNLIDFWASWCAPCRANGTKLQKLYNNYKNRDFNIIAISIDESFQKWKNAVKLDNNDWVNISYLSNSTLKLNNFELIGSANPVSIEIGGLRTIPLYFLLDPSGKIILKTNSIESIELKLQEIFE